MAQETETDLGIIWDLSLYPIIVPSDLNFLFAHCVHFLQCHTSQDLTVMDIQTHNMHLCEGLGLEIP